MKITIWESCLIEKIREINITGVSYEQLNWINVLKSVDNLVLERSKENVCNDACIKRSPNVEEDIESETVNIDILWEDIKQREWIIYLIPLSNRNNELKLLTKNALINLVKGSLIKIEKKNKEPFYMIVEKVEEVNEAYISDLSIPPNPNKNLLEIIKFTGVVFDSLNDIKTGD